jgi:FAD/FMN-containing dehydrogenase
MESACTLNSQAPDFVEGVAFAPDDFVLTTARLTSQSGPVSDYKGMKMYYRSLQSCTEDRLTMRDFLWRWDPDWFWCSWSFGMQNPLLRRLFGRWMLRSSAYWKIQSWYRQWDIDEKVYLVQKALHLPAARIEIVIQDIEVPVVKASKFLDFYFREINIRPVWVCPLRPLESANRWTLYAMQPGALYLNFGFWGSVQTSFDPSEGHFNRRVEQIVRELDGHKSLYSTAFYPQEEFWRLYNGAAYQTLKSKYDPGHAFPDLYQKAVLRQ